MEECDHLVNKAQGQVGLCLWRQQSTETNQLLETVGGSRSRGCVSSCRLVGFVSYSFGRWNQRNFTGGVRGNARGRMYERV